MKKILAGILALTACFALVGCKEEQTTNNGGWRNMEDWGDYYDDILDDTLNSMYTTFTESDGKIDLPAAGYYKCATGTEIRLEKATYSGQAYNTGDYISIDVTLYCEAVAVDNNGYAYVRVEWYDKDGYMIDNYLTSQGSLSAGKKFTVNLKIMEEWSYEEYQQKGLRLEIVNVDE